MTPEPVKCRWLGKRIPKPGKHKPGDMHYAHPDWHLDGEKCVYWDNCTGHKEHIIVTCPDGHPWDINGRASNCTKPNDRTHRCWIRHGDPPNITIDKNGDTCGAGAGSIQTGGYHGFLRDGQLVSA